MGVDLSGDPTRGSFETWLPALQRARDGGLAQSLHCAEVENPAEVRAMLAFRPERLVRSQPPFVAERGPLCTGRQPLWV